MEFAVIGDAVNVASRLNNVARGGQVLIGPKTREAAHASLDTREIPNLQVRGRKAAITAYELLGIKTPSS